MQATLIFTDVLQCPRCDGECLHHRSVAAYFREKEDSESGLMAEAYAGGVAIDNSPECMQRNPSLHRNGIVVRFWCEECNCATELALAQHKGSTLVVWLEPQSSESQDSEPQDTDIQDSSDGRAAHTRPQNVIDLCGAKQRKPER